MANMHLGAAVRYIHRLFGEGTLAGLPDAQLLEHYASHRDELAFKALVQRHGPMVLAVCNGVLDDPNDVDDAFQAAFLLLARKAPSLWVNGSLGGWLHRVAWRIAIQVKSDAARRCTQERRAAELTGARSSSSTPWDDTDVVLHQEIDRLPERFRKPIVLCYLENMTYQQAASHLRWSEGTTQGRLTRARDLLRARLTRRGVTLAGANLGVLAAPKAARAVSMAMLQATVRSTRHFAWGAAAEAGTVSTTATALVRQTLRTMMIVKLKIAASVALFIGTLTCVATGLAAMGPAVRDQPATGSPGNVEDNRLPRRTSWSTNAEEPAQTAVEELPGFRGQVLEPAPGPAPGAAPSPLAGNNREEPVNVSMDLKSEWRLNPGDSLFSPLGSFRFTMKADGNLVLFAIDDMQLPLDLGPVLAHSPEAMKLYTKPIWSTGTHVPKAGAGPGSFCVMQDDGNFVVYDQDGHRCFETATGGHPGSFLRCQNDGNLVIYTPDLRPIWHTGTHVRSDDDGRPCHPRVPVRRVRPKNRAESADLSMDLKPSWRLNPGDSVFSALGGLRLIMQEDGNLVLYHIEDTRLPEDLWRVVSHSPETLDLYTEPVWSTGTSVPGAGAGTSRYCIMEDDGNFVVYDKDGNRCFQSNTRGHPGSFLRCQDDGNLVIYTPELKAIWHSRTHSRTIDSGGSHRR